MRITFWISPLLFFVGIAAMLCNAFGDSLLSKAFVGAVLGYFLANSFEKRIS